MAQVKYKFNKTGISVMEYQDGSKVAIGKGQIAFFLPTKKFHHKMKIKGTEYFNFALTKEEMGVLLLVLKTHIKNTKETGWLFEGTQ